MNHPQQSKNQPKAKVWRIDQVVVLAWFADMVIPFGVAAAGIFFFLKPHEWFSPNMLEMLMGLAFGATVFGAIVGLFRLMAGQVIVGKLLDRVSPKLSWTSKALAIISVEALVWLLLAGSSPLFFFYSPVILLFVHAVALSSIMHHIIYYFGEEVIQIQNRELKAQESQSEQACNPTGFARPEPFSPDPAPHIPSDSKVFTGGKAKTAFKPL